MTPRFAGIFALVALLAACLTAPASADLADNLGALSGDNAKGYLAPLPEALSGTLNSAIFQSGSIPMAGLSFTVGVKVMGVRFDDEDRVYQPTPPPGFTPDGSQPGFEAPTVIGSTEAPAQNGQGGTTLYHPGGFDISNFTIAVPQLTIGSVIGTRAVVRWISVDLGDSDLGQLDLWGVGLQHSLSQYVKVLPVDLAIGGMYQSFNIGDDLIDVKSFHFDVTGSRSFGAGFAKLTPYASLGYDNLKMDVSYESSVTPGETIDVDFDAENNVHLGIGAMLSMGFVKLHGEFDTGAATGAAIGVAFGL